MVHYEGGSLETVENYARVEVPDMDGECERFRFCPTCGSKIEWPNDEGTYA